MKRFLLLVLLLTLLTAPALAEEIAAFLTVGEAACVEICRADTADPLHPSAYMPMDWCSLQAEEGAVTLLANPPAAGEWRIPVTLRAYAPGDKKGRTLREFTLRIVVSPDEEGNVFLPDFAYAGDGQGMVAVNAPQADYFRLPGAAVMGQVPQRERLIYTGLEGHAGAMWYRVYHRALGYGYIRADQGDPYYEHPLEITYRPGEAFRCSLWHTTAPLENVRVQSHECPDGTLEAAEFRTVARENGVWETGMRAVLTASAPHARHILTILACDEADRPMEVISVIATIKEE